MRTGIRSEERLASKRVVSAMYGISSFVLGKVEEIASRSQIRDGDGSRGRELEIRFSVSLDNDITLSVTPSLLDFFYLLFFLFFLFFWCDTFLTFHCVPLSSLKSGSLFIRVALKCALYLSPAAVSSCRFPW